MGPQCATTYVHGYTLILSSYDNFLESWVNSNKYTWLERYICQARIQHLEVEGVSDATPRHTKFSNVEDPSRSRIQKLNLELSRYNGSTLRLHLYPRVYCSSNVNFRSELGGILSL